MSGVCGGGTSSQGSYSWSDLYNRNKHFLLTTPRPDASSRAIPTSPVAQLPPQHEGNVLPHRLLDRLLVAPYSFLSVGDDGIDTARDRALRPARHCFCRLLGVCSDQQLAAREYWRHPRCTMLAFLDGSGSVSRDNTTGLLRGLASEAKINLNQNPRLCLGMTELSRN